MNTKLDFSTRQQLRLFTLLCALTAVWAATDLRIQNGQVQAFAGGRRRLASPSDARCEDKEGAYSAMQGFLALYEITQDAEHLRWARHAADVVLTYLVVWDIDLRPGRLRDNNLRTRGWTSVSVQNQHLDVFGVLIAADIYRLGQILHDHKLRRTAVLMYRSCGQLIDPWGSQGEQLQETNYVQGREEPRDLLGVRGGYNERWTVFWITAHFLNGAAQLAEMGVPIWE